MEASAIDRFPLTVPLIVDEEQHAVGTELEDRDSNHSHDSTEGTTSTFNSHDSTEGTTSTFKTMFNGLNALSGVGILSVPYALASGGWLSLTLLFMIAIAAFYSGILIKRCMEADPNIRTYPDIGQLAFGHTGRIIVSIFMYTELYLVATGFLILEGDNLQNLVPNMGFEAAGLHITGEQCFVVIVALIILPSMWLDNLSLLSFVSASGVLASAIILASIAWTGAVDGIGFENRGEALNLQGIPTSVSLYAFCYCAHPVFPTLYTSMKKKHQFSNVLLVCFILCTLCYATMAVLGYLMFGPNVQSQVTLNLPTDKFSSRLAIYTTLVNPIAKYALMVTPIVNAVKNRFPCHCNKRPFNFFISTAFVASTVVVAIVIPFFGYLMSLVGAFLSVTASIILPCLCYLKISGASNQFGLEVAVIWSIVVLGGVVAVFGTYSSLLDIVYHL